ncbi:MAG: hypothetical protein BGN92_05550 [Sphingobacteriales bacterium 41-5]|nr:MAG: hypothetical protein BGN92_05550 [Sphingobacteriales bacterium 41-5]
MAINIVDLVKNYASNEMISKASSFLGENEGGVSKAVSGLVPSLLGGLLGKASASEAGAEEIFQSAKAANESGLLGNLGSLFGNADVLSKGSSLFSGLFGGKSNSIIDAISSFAGIKSSSSGSLISMLLPLITGVLGKHAADNNLGASGLASFLGSQKANIQSALPSGLGSIGSLLGLGSLGAAATETVADVKETAASAYNYAEDKVEKTGGGMKWLLPLLLLAALALGLWYFFGKGCNEGAGTATSDTTATTGVDEGSVSATPPATASGSYDSTSGNYIYDVGADREITLADGNKLTVGANSTEAKLYDFLTNGTVDTVDKSKGWMTLDRVYFNTSSSTLTAESQKQLENIAAILKNFATAKVKMGGYTDNTGSVDGNVKISGERAKAAAAELVKLGVAAASVESEGYGPEHPVCAANDTPECKAQNRRVDIRVTAK